MSRELGEKCVEIARQVRDGEWNPDLGQFLRSYEVACMGCGCETTMYEHEHGSDGGCCRDCHQRISQEIYEHEMGLLRSGYYGQ